MLWLLLSLFLLFGSRFGEALAKGKLCWTSLWKSYASSFRDFLVCRCILVNDCNIERPFSKKGGLKLALLPFSSRLLSLCTKKGIPLQQRTLSIALALTGSVSERVHYSDTRLTCKIFLFQKRHQVFEKATEEFKSTDSSNIKGPAILARSQSGWLQVRVDWKSNNHSYGNVKERTRNAGMKRL